jgi:hypothetical protein
MNNNDKELLLMILEKTDQIKEDINEIKIVQVKHEANLQDHMKRSLANEEQVAILKEEVKPVLEGLGFLKLAAKVGTVLISLCYGAARLFFR